MRSSTKVFNSEKNINQKFFQSFYWFSTNLFISKTNLSLLRINFSQTNRNDVWSTLIFKCIFDGNLISELLFRKFIFISHSSRFNSMLTLKPFICDSLNGKHSSSEYVYTERYETQVTNFGLLSLNILAKCFLQYRVSFCL
jgi:hypothetical protein